MASIADTRLLSTSNPTINRYHEKTVTTTTRISQPTIEVTLRVKNSNTGHEVLITKIVPAFATIGELKMSLEGVVTVPAEWLVLSDPVSGQEFHGQEEETVKVKDLIDEEGKVTLDVRTVDPERFQLGVVQNPQISRQPTGSVGKGVKKQGYVVQIVRSVTTRQQLGGYRNKVTGQKYFNATTQTCLLSKKLSLSEADVSCTRQTQTPTGSRQISVQTLEETGTQTPMDNGSFTWMKSGSRVISPRTEEDIVAAKERKNEAAIVIQKYWRRHLARKRIKVLQSTAKNQWNELKEILANQPPSTPTTSNDDQSSDETDVHQTDELRHWQTQLDDVHRALETWRADQLRIIDATSSGADRKAALCMLLDKEAEMLAAVDRVRAKAKESQQLLALKELLKLSASTMRWTSKRTGQEMVADDAISIRGRQLYQIYGGLTDHKLSIDDRKEVLENLQQIVQENGAMDDLSRMILELVDRELDYMELGIGAKGMRGLRARLVTLFVKFCQSPSHNPGCLRRNRSEERKSVTFALDRNGAVLEGLNQRTCSACNLLKPASHFISSTSSVVAGKCKKCRKKVSLERAQPTCYQKILGQIRHDYGDDSYPMNFAFRLNEKQIRFLVEAVWKAKSVVSGLDLGSSEDPKLVFCKWRREENWSPWNTALLTVDEGQVHADALDSGIELKDIYDPEVIKTVELRQQASRIHFTDLRLKLERVLARDGGHS